MAALLVTYTHQCYFRLTEDPDVEIIVDIVDNSASSSVSRLGQIPNGTYGGSFTIEEQSLFDVAGVIVISQDTDNTQVSLYTTPGGSAVLSASYDDETTADWNRTSGSIMLAPSGTQALMITGGLLKINSEAVIDHGLTYFIVNVHGITQSVGAGSYITNSLSVTYSYGEEAFPKCVMTFTTNGTTYTYDVYSTATFTIPIGTTFIINSVTRPHS